MKLWMVGVEGVKKNYQDWLQFYARNEKACFGPVRLFLGTLYIGRDHYDLSEVTIRCEKLKEEFGTCNIKPYGKSEGVPRRWVIWVYSFDRDKDPNLLEGYKDAFDRITFSDRVYNRLPQPVQGIRTSKAFQRILDEQRALNEAMGKLRDDLVLPMQYHGMSLEDSLRWLRLKKKSKKRRERFPAVPDELFFRDTNTCVQGIAEKAKSLDAKLKELNNQNFVQNCLTETQNDNPYRVIINLHSWKNTGDGYARLFS